MNTTINTISQKGKLILMDWIAIIRTTAIALAPYYVLTVLHNLEGLDYGEYKIPMAAFLSFCVEVIRRKYSTNIYVQRG